VVILGSVNIQSKRRIFLFTTEDGYRGMIQEAPQILCCRISQSLERASGQEHRMAAMASLPGKANGPWMRLAEIEDTF
jgi:hypothetical protein